MDKDVLNHPLMEDWKTTYNKYEAYFGGLSFQPEFVLFDTTMQKLNEISVSNRLKPLQQQKILEYMAETKRKNKQFQTDLEYCGMAEVAAVDYRKYRRTHKNPQKNWWAVMKDVLDYADKTQRMRELKEYCRDYYLENRKRLKQAHINQQIWLFMKKVKRSMQ